jgi:hypothetical protein
VRCRAPLIQVTEEIRNRASADGLNPRPTRRFDVAHKGAGGNPGAITTKGGDGARGSTGTGRGGATGTGARKASKKKAPDKTGDEQTTGGGD